jgi:serine-type D-Ala-D-Ala carboxypeptidase/endopeptidase
MICRLPCLIAAAAFALWAQDAVEIRALLANRVDEAKKAVGIVVGTLSPSGRMVIAQGVVAKDIGTKPDENTIFEIGSITKVFTSLILADMVERGEVKLDDPVARYLPASVKMPQFGDRPITLLDISMQISGLPRMPHNFSPADRENPYADYTEKKLYEFLSGCKLTRAPGEKYEYSNLAVGLLGHALARRAGMSYEELVQQRVLDPLGMTSTSVQFSEAQKRRLAQGHTRALEPAKNWDLAVLAGAGGLRSSASDMLRFLAAALHRTETPLAPAFKRLVSMHKPAGAPGMEIAMGWHVLARTDTPIVWHNGGTAGYHSFAGFNPGKRTAAVVLCNTDYDIDDIGRHILDARYEANKLPPYRERKEVTLDPKVLERYPGKYEIAPAGAILTVSLQGGVLYAQVAGQPRLRLYAEKEDEFFYKAVDAQITFVSGGLVLHQNGRDFKAAKR